MRILPIIIALVFCLCAGIYFYPDYATKFSTMPRLNSNSSGELPKNFRLTHLKASGSGQFTEPDLEKMKETIPHDKIAIIDLREEPHAFLNGDAISWYTYNNWLNKGKTREQIKIDEVRRLKKLSNQSFAVFYFKYGHYPHFYRVKEVVDAETVALRNGLEYFHFPVSDHTHPDDHIVDDFVTFIKNLDRDVWLHFHCSAGRGRTTTFLAMYEIMLNGEKAPLEEIVERQESIGGINLLHSGAHDMDDWKIPHAVYRTSFIKDFYQYTLENPDFALSWSEWIEGQEKAES